MRWTRERCARRGSQGGATRERSNGAQDERRCCGRRSRVVLAPVAGVKSRGGLGGPTGRAKPFNPRGDGGKKELVTRESAKETVKTIRVRECRAISGASAVNTRAHISLPSAYGAPGALGARHSPRSLS